jgi:hypothetical protein
MNKRLLIAGLFFILICFSGCILQSPGDDPSYSVLPRLLLDYDFDSDETKIWVESALSDYRYTNITIEINYKNNSHSISDNNTYGLFASTQLKIFNLHIYIVAEEKIFELEINVDVDELREDLIIITTYDEETDEEIEETISEEDLPFKKILDEIDVEV